MFTPKGVCIYADTSIHATQLPHPPSYKYNHLPQWSKQFPKSHHKKQRTSFFDVRPDVAGSFIESALEEAPQNITEKLFELKVKDDLLLDRLP
ncbi:hypothetical protein [Candidatus Uabimicrobium sp. HlEnr_7]|uniref:hypothetical protein n=1 Tax=Candidatus Uabimicrobium helgolandensis TaxID=3095367 RepID=UPI0035587032